MPEFQPQTDTPKIVTGFEEVPPASTPLRVQVVASPESNVAEQAAAKSAADAEERAQVERATEAEVPIDLRSEAAKVNDQIHKRIIEARLQAREAEIPPPPQPVSPFITDQTKREMEEGAKQSQRHAEQREAALATKKPPSPRSPTLSPITVPEGSTEVFRPNDYIPDQLKKQGYVK